MVSLKYLLNCRNLIFLVVLFSFFDNLGMKKEDLKRQYVAVLVGDAGVGKTQIFRRFKNEDFLISCPSTIAMDFVTKIFSCGNVKCHITLYDTGGQERFKNLVKVYLKDKNFIFFVYDISNKNSFDSIKNWVEMAREVNNKTYFVLVGNKCDLKKEKSVPTEEAKEYAEKNNMRFIEVSAREQKNISSVLFYPVFGDYIIPMEEKKSKINLNKIGMLEVGLKNDFVLKSFCERLCDCD